MINTPRPAPPRLNRRFAKFGYFLFRGNGLKRSWWLATHDAVVGHDYRGVTIGNLVAGWNAVGNWTELSVADGKLIFSTLGLPVVGEDLVAQEHATLQRARSRGFSVSRSGAHLTVESDTLRLHLTTAEEITMFREIVLDRCYGADLCGDWAVLDVGANVGIASLFFASQNHVRRVIAFEPFGPTADLHAANVASNPSLAGKIELRRYGLGARDEQLDVNYDPDLRGSMTVSGLGEWRGRSTRPTEKVRIQVRSASAIWRESIDLLQGLRLMAKLDCEGSEFAILEEWDQCGALERVDVLVMEWHGTQSAALLERLARNGFGVHSRPLVAQGNLGLIWAWRDRCPSAA